MSSRSLSWIILNYSSSHNITTHSKMSGPKAHRCCVLSNMLPTFESYVYVRCVDLFCIELKCQSHLLQLSLAGKSTLFLAEQHLAWPGTWSSCADAAANAANVKGIYPERWFLLATLRVQTRGMWHAKAKPTLTKSVPEESSLFDLRGYLTGRYMIYSTYIFHSYIYIHTDI